ncbi:hypothetical protein DH2020_044372 [Rehmannia glutinosa]|uniref:chitinase n=1 Tax=Rehmannia glutinosa TaxID=99300 RepID=A0ABR0UHT0_REHGL
MGLYSQTSLLILLSILIAFPLFSFSQSQKPCGISVYWRGNSAEGTLSDACRTGHYKYVNIAFLMTFGNGQTPVLKFADYSSTDTESMRNEIQLCQNMGIQVLLSLGGSFGNYTLSSRRNAKRVARYLYHSFLWGKHRSFVRPFGNISLNGIDFDIENPGSNLYWDVLARALSRFSKPRRKVYLSAAPGCTYPDRNLDAAIRTGLFDYVAVKFYGNPQCEYTWGDASRVLASWNVWSSSLPTNSQLLLGSIAFPATGYMFPSQIVYEILPEIMSSPNYGGVMVWDWYYDSLWSHSKSMYQHVCQS